MIVRSGVFIKSLMNTRTIVSIHNTSEYSLFFFTFPQKTTASQNRLAVVF